MSHGWLCPAETSYFSQAQVGLHWQAGPHRPVRAGAVHLQAGEQVQGLQLHWLVMINSMSWFVVLV